MIDGGFFVRKRKTTPDVLGAVPVWVLESGGIPNFPECFLNPIAVTAKRKAPFGVLDDL